MRDFEELSFNRLSEILPELPSEIRIRYEKLGLPSKQVDTLLGNMVLRQYFEASINGDNALSSLSANYLTSDVVGLVGSGAFSLSDSDEFKSVFRELMLLLKDRKITSRVAKDLLVEVMKDGRSPHKLIGERGLSQSDSADTLGPIVAQVIHSNPTVVEEVKGGKVAALQFLVGQGMKLSRGAANPETLRALFESRIK